MNPMGENDFLAVPKIEPFTGANPEIGIENWIDEFEDVCKMQGAGPEQRLTLLRMLLRGPAKTRYKRYPSEVQNDVEQLKARLKETYSKQRDKTLCMLNFQNRRQRPNEAVIEYASALENLFNMAYGQMQSANDYAMIKLQFLRGIKPSLSKVMNQFPNLSDDWDEVVKIAQLQEQRSQCSRYDNHNDGLDEEIRDLRQQVLKLTDERREVINASGSQDDCYFGRNQPAKLHGRKWHCEACGMTNKTNEDSLDVRAVAQSPTDEFKGIYVDTDYEMQADCAYALRSLVENQNTVHTNDESDRRDMPQPHTWATNAQYYNGPLQ